MTTYYVDCDAAGGGDGSVGSPYDAVSVAEAAQNGTFTDVIRFLCSASAGGKDTVGTFVWGGDQTAAYYLLIQAADGHRASAQWNPNIYGIEISGSAVNCIAIGDDYCRVDGIQGRVTASTGNYNGCFVTTTNQSATNRVDFTNLLALGPVSDNTYSFTCYNNADPDGVMNLVNCVGRIVTTTDSNRTCVTSAGTTLNLYNCTFIGGQYAVQARSGCVVNCRNVYAAGSGNEAFYRRDTATLNKVNCASSDGTADDTDAYTTASNCLVNVPLDATTLLDPLNATVLSRDYHLAGVDSDLYGAGVAPGGSDPLNYTTDIDGDTIGVGGRYDIGVDWFVAAGGGQIARPVSDVSVGGWTASSGTDRYAMVDEETASDADYITSGAAPANDECVLALGALSTPDAGTVTLRVRAKYV